MTRQSIVDTVEAHYLALVIDTLGRTGVLARLSEPSDPSEVARELELDPVLLTMLLDWLSERTDWLERQADGRFVRTDERPGFLEHMLDQYMGGYGQVVAALARVLKGEPAAKPDLERHARAFTEGAAETGTGDELTALVLNFGATHIVELGCGGGQRLYALAATNPEIAALGIDANAFVAEAARDGVAKRGLADRITILTGDALDQLAGYGSREACQMVIASSLLNEYWSSEGALAGFIARLGSLLPGRILLASDYYSRLGGGGTGGCPARTVIHDLAQIASGQGLPPADADRWSAAYRSGGGELLQSIEASGDGIERFIHIVRLPE